jgi:glycosyltransferase involved in cell wall biosynthesis
LFEQGNPRQLADRIQFLLDNPHREVEMGRNGRQRAWLYNLTHPLANRWVDGQTTITQCMAKTVRIPSQQLWGTWTSGVNPDRFAPAQIARRWPLAGRPINLIYIGCLHYERNLMTLSRAVEKANTEGMAFTQSLVRYSMERADLEKFATQTGRRIRVVPPVRHDQVPGLLAQAHVGVLPFSNEKHKHTTSNHHLTNCQTGR